MEGLEYKTHGVYRKMYRDKEGTVVSVNYLSDWNDLHRAWSVIYEKIRYRPVGLDIAFYKNDKKMAFSILVEAARWIKQKDQQ